ncbi:CHAT domain-containing protein [Brachybacterium paraconglomeratum]|uniref:CHAT domain-containing protein n=1 Tax=Brachybacterium paraconglomeratum TaxID=173362 RepID=UPI003FD379E4
MIRPRPRPPGHRRHQRLQHGPHLVRDLLPRHRSRLAQRRVNPLDQHGLVVLNACESLAGADDLLQTVPTVIAMSDSINDASAVVFAARFYSAVASAQSVSTALEQAKVAMAVSALDDADLPEVRAREDVDLVSLLLVQPMSSR